MPVSLVFVMSLLTSQENGKAYSPNKKTVDSDYLRLSKITTLDIECHFTEIIIYTI
jgi:hypothetical protein